MGRQSPATTTTTTTSKVKVGKKKNKKRICKYFASGNCKFGEKCRDIHEGGSTKNEVAEPPSTTNSQVNTPPQPPSSTPTTNMNVCFKSDLKELKDQALVTQKHLSEMNLMMAKLQMSYALANSALDCMQSKISDMENIIEDETPNEGRDVEEETHRVQQQVVSARDNINEIPPAVTPTSITSTKKSKAVPSPPAKPQSTKSTNKSKAAPVHQQSINPQPVKSSDVKPNKEKMKLEVEEGIKGASSTSNTKMPILPPPIKSTTVEVSKPDKPQETVTKTPIKSTTVVVSKPDKREHQPEGWPALGDIDSKVKDEKKITAPTTREGSSLVPPPPSRDDNTRSMLDDIIINASGPYIGSPYKYISYLRKELEFSTAEEFVEIIKECLDVLASIKSGNTSKEDLHFLHTLLGGVEKGKEDEFCRVLLSSVSIITEVEATTPPIVEAPIVETPRVVADEMDTVNVAEISNPPPVVTSRPVKRSVVVELGGGTITSRQAQSKEKKPQQDLPQEKTTVKPKVFKADRATQKEAKKKERQAKLAEASRKKGEKISTVTLEQTAQEIVREDKRKSQYTAVTGGTVSPPPTGQEASRGLLSPRHSAVTSTRQRPAPQAAKPIVTPENFSLYIKRDGLAKENQDISPIFKLLQNKTTRDEGRQLMQLEGDTKVCKQAIVEMHKRKEALAKSIDSERANIVKWKGEMNKTEVSMKVKWSLDNLLTMGAVQLNKVLREMDDEDDQEIEELDRKSKSYKDYVAGETIITINITNVAEGSTHELSAKLSTSVTALLKDYAKQSGILLKSHRFEYKGNMLFATDNRTLQDLNIEQDDTISVTRNETDTESTEDMKEKKGDKGDEEGDANKQVLDVDEWMKGVYAYVIGAEERQMSLKDKAAEKIQKAKEKEMPIVVEEKIVKSNMMEDQQEKEESKATSREQDEMKERKSEAKQLFADKKATKEEKKKKLQVKKNRQKEAEKARVKLERLDNQIKEAQQHIKEQKKSIIDMVAPMVKLRKDLKELRDRIASVKGGGLHEDPNFHIDGTRDSRGHTFLMLAAQNQDVITASLCFQLQADPMASNKEGFMAIDYSHFFSFDNITELILQNGGVIPQKRSEAWASLDSRSPLSQEASKDWIDAQEVADAAALPAETLIESPQDCEEDEHKRMHHLTEEEKSKDFTCFESRLIDQNINTNSVNRVVLLEQAVYNWLCTADASSTSNFITLIEGLKPIRSRQPGVNSTIVRRRSIIGTTTTFELLSASLFILDEGVKTEKVVLFSPYIGGEADGMTHIGILMWGMVNDVEASLYKTLISNTEFMRNKIRLDDRFPEVKDPDSILKLGRDMHLLGLKSTSIYTASAMELFMLNLDEGHLDQQRIQSHDFSLKRRIVYSEQQVNKAIFRGRGSEQEDHNDILASERVDMSSLIYGGAGTGKTLLLIKKVVREEPSKKILIVSRLSRLVNVIKSAVENARDAGLENLTFMTYDELLKQLARRVAPSSESDSKLFITFDRIRFDCEDSAGISFLSEFVEEYLSKLERKKMDDNSIQPLTLWHAIVTIKSNVKCSISKSSLSLEEYLALPSSFGLQKKQREISYQLFLRYEQWREQKSYWDETDRTMYVLKHGPNVFREEPYLSWTERVVKRGEMDLLDEEGDPLHPFFFDMVCSDEAQDFSELDLALFLRMSSGVRSVFINADPAQSVELGISMRKGTINDVVHSQIFDKHNNQVKDNLQEIMLQTNHRTHHENLSLGKAIRSVLARSFKLPNSNEHSLIHGRLPQLLRIKKISDLANQNIFKGGNVVFISPDEIVQDLRTQFHHLGIENDLFGVKEAKGLEFSEVALIGFWTFIESRGSSAQWQNCLRWLSSSSKITITNTGENVCGAALEECDYTLSYPQLADEGMFLYTALTRARDQLYLIEPDSTKKANKRGVGLADFAFRRFVELDLAKVVTFIDEGFVEMTSAQHKARGITLINTALTMLQNREPISAVKDKFLEAKKRFVPGKGNDRELLDKCSKHLDAIMSKWTIMQYAKNEFYEVQGGYCLENKFTEVVKFEEMVSTFFGSFLCDSFMVEEVTEVRRLMEEIFLGTPYAVRFQDVCTSIERLECFV